MTVDRISKIKETLKALSEKKAKAEGANENYLNQLKKEFGITSIEEAESKIEELQNNLRIKEKRLKTTGDKIEEITDWDELI